MKNIDVKATILKNILATVCLGVGVALVIMGALTIPPKISMNQQVLQHARYIAAVISRSVYISVGLLIGCVSLLKMDVVKKN